MYQPDPTFAIETRVAAYPEQIWEAWTDGDRLAQWFSDKASGWPAEGSKLDLTWDGFGFTAQYQIHEIKPLEKLVLKARMTGGMQTLTVGIRREGQQTVLSLAEVAPQFQKTDPESQSDTASGWKMALAICKLYVERYFGQPRSSFFCLSGEVGKCRNFMTNFVERLRRKQRKKAWRTCFLQQGRMYSAMEILKKLPKN